MPPVTAGGGEALEGVCVCWSVFKFTVLPETGYGATSPAIMQVDRRKVVTS